MASAHGRNNCLIDSLILCLCAAGDLPKHLAGDVRQRKGLVDACRAMLVAAVGSGAGDLDAGHFPYLDAGRDAAFIIRFLLDEFDARVRNYILIVHDRFGHGGADPERGIVHIELRDDMEGDCAELHVYNHTDGRGCGYHFDALLSAQLVTPSPSIALQPANAPRAKAAVPVSVLQPAWDRDRATRALHSFITKRCSGVHVNEADIAQLHCNWDATDALGQQIQTLLSAGNVYMERGLHNARYVARTFRAWYNMMPAEAGEMRGYTLGKAPPATEKTTQGTPNYARQQQADAAHSPTPGGPVQAKIDHVSNGGDRTQRKRCSPGKKGAKTRVPRGEDSTVKKQAASKNKKQHKRHLLGTTERKGLERKRKAHRGQGSRGKGKPAPETSQPLLKRLTGKQPDPRQSMDEEEQLPDIYAMHVLTSGPGNDDPRAAREAFIRAIASLLVRKPTLPERFQWVSGNELGFDLPNAHCAFGGCGWEGDTEAELGHHLVTRHRAELQEPHQEAWNPEKVASHLVATYEKAVTWVCQSAAPVANPSIDRRCLRAFRKEFEGDAIVQLICFVCARRFPHREAASNQKIGYRRAMNKAGTRIFGRPVTEIDGLLGLATYVELYGDVAGNEDDSFAEWSCAGQCDGRSFKLLCCPEDKRCNKRCGPATLCKACEIPVRRSCWESVAWDGRLPAEALGNDMMIFYGPKEIYDFQVTFMEMLCASPCVTTLLCFSLEKRYRMHRAWDENAWMNQHRLAARGNATTFPLAWENLVEQLQGLEGENAVSLLPRTGQQLAEVVRVLIKSNAAEEETAERVKDILHEATVRRDVVLRLIEAAVRRKHPAYRQVSMEQVALKARDLPEHGGPPEVVAVLPHDTDLDNLQPQKVATPVPECVTPLQAASELGCWLKPNAVVCEKSSVGSGDLNAQQVATLKATVSDERNMEQSPAIGSVTLTTGNRLFDQFKAEYFGMAFPHVFKHCTAMPDPPHWSPNPRHRRAQDAPRLELSLWVRAMARRCEAQVGRDWVFGFTSWNLLFRSTLNLSRAPVRYTEPIFDEKTETWRNLTAKDIEAGAVQLLAALQGTYKDTSWKRDVASFVRDVLLNRFWRALDIQTLSPVYSKMHIVESHLDCNISTTCPNPSL